MPNYHYHSSSRRRTPWDGNEEITSTQSFIRTNYHSLYNYKHPKLSQTDEAEFVNSFEPDMCKRCGGSHFKKAGFTSNGIQRYQCNDCHGTFTVLTNTIFENHKISIMEWIEFLLNIFGYVSFSSTSRNSRIADTTTKFWMIKLFELLKDYQNDIVLSGTVYIDETLYQVVKGDVQFEDGKRLSGMNNHVIGIGCDDQNVYCKLEGISTTSSNEWTLNAFSKHIAEGSILIHDGTYCHKDLIKNLHLINQPHNVAKAKRENDDSDPLKKINDYCSLLKSFLGAHRGFDRDYLQDYLNLFVFICNPPHNKLEKIEILFNKAISNNISIKYRKLFSKKQKK